MVDFSKYQKNKDSESLTLEKKVSLMKDITEDKKAQILNFVGTKNTDSDEIVETSMSLLNKSAKLNLLKFIYPLLTGKSTTNKKKKVMKKAVIDKLSKF